ncbi:DUF935 domain-containing protein [Ferrimonas balearica]|uniref:DUF935 domain-containing protein n=1 Tax=Ferrimonas balearica TaxID=44012 RepID=UPI001FED604E|nr:DUF935 domain-containing protein [Ferrimonas balearica]
MATPQSLKARLGRNLKRQQTDDVRLGHLHKHFAEHPSSGLTPARAAAILLAAEHDNLIAQCELAEDLEEKDGHLFAELDKRKRALLSVPWRIVPPREATAQEQRDCQTLQTLLEEASWLTPAIKDAADAILKGYSCQELIWQRDGAGWWIEAIEHRDPAWFQVHPERRNELRLRDNSVEGAPLWPMGWWCHTHKAKSGYLARSGLVRQLIWPFIFKNYSVRDLAEFLEIYGLPLRLGQYPSGASDEEKRALMTAVMSLGHNAGGIMPKGMVLDFHQAAQGHADPFELMVTYMDKVMSRVILGGTLTSQADGQSSTNALGNVHNEVRQELRDADLIQLQASLSRDIVRPLYLLNVRQLSDPRRLPRFEFDITEAEDLTDYAAALPKLVEAGMPIPVRWAMDKLQIPEAEGEEPVLGQRPEPAPTAPPSQPNALAALNAQPNQDNADAFSQQLDAEAAPLMARMMAPVQQMVMSADSLEGLRASLLTLEGQLDSRELEQVMREAIAAAYLLGRVEVEDDATGQADD